MEERHTFELLWPLFGFCQYLGLFPCKRTIDPISGSIQLRPIHWIRQLAFFVLIALTIAMLGNVALFIPFTLIEDKSIEEAFKCLQNANPALGENLVDKLTMFTFMTFMMILYYLSTWGIFKTKTGLCELSCFRRSRSSDKMIWRSFVIQTVMMFLYPVLNPIMNVELLKACSPSTSVAVRFLMSIPNHFTCLVLLLPLLIFMAISLEVLIGLMDFCEKLKQNKELLINFNFKLL